MLSSSIIVAALAALASAAPSQHTSSPQQSLADSVNFIVKTIGANPNPSALPNINNWLVNQVHDGAGSTVAILADPTTYSFNRSQPGVFRNGTDTTAVDNNSYLTNGIIFGNTPMSWYWDSAASPSGNPGAYQGTIATQFGIGTIFDVRNAQLTWQAYSQISTYACPKYPVEGGDAIAVLAADRYAAPLAGCWEVALYAECAGPVSAANKKAFPHFRQATCYKNASSVAVPS